MASVRNVEIDPEFARSLSHEEASLVRLYYAEDASPHTIEAEVGMPFSYAMEVLDQIGEAEYLTNWRGRESGGPMTIVCRKQPSIDD